MRQSFLLVESYVLKYLRFLDSKKVLLVYEQPSLKNLLFVIYGLNCELIRTRYILYTF